MIQIWFYVENEGEEGVLDASYMSVWGIKVNDSVIWIVKRGRIL